MNDLPGVNDFIQANRLLRIETPFGADAFLMESFAGREAVNELFTFEVVVRAKRDDVTPQELVGKNVDVSLDRGDEGPRRVWNGLVVGLTEEPRLTRALRQYVLTLRPDLWLLSQKSDCRIWQNKTSVEVAETLLSEHGLRAPDVSGVLNTPVPQEYSIQWNETDLAFLLRRLEEDGLFYWIRQADGAQTVVIADNPNAWDDGHDGENGGTRFASGSTDRDHIGAWTRRYAFIPGKRAGRDWNFETPTITPGSDTPSLVKLPRNGDYELYEYPARALDLGASETAMKLRMQSVEADHERVEGGSTTRTLAPGAKVTPYDVAHPEYTFETSVITAIEHYARDTTYETGSDHPIYKNRFEASPARLPLTPHRHTPRPRIDGAQIAIVAGPSGEEIHTEQYGRIKLWFPWDRRAKKDGSDTKWVRVSQSWGGGQWGQQIIPRIGMEVAVSYLDGDPDRPLVVGVVPNPTNYVPYQLPGHKTKSVLRSNTHKGTGYNELSFEDENGKENLFTHAQKDMTTKVLNDQTSRVDANALHSIGANQSLEVGANMSKQVGGGLNMVVGGVGGIVNAIAGGLLASLSGKSASMLQQAMGVVGAAAAGQPSSADRSAGNASTALADPAAGGAGGGSPLGDIAVDTMAHAGVLGGGVLGAMASAMDTVRSGVNDAKVDDMRTAGGASMSASGSGLASQVASMIGKGVFNTLVSRMQNTSVGIAQTEQVGVAKVLTVGQVYNQSVGNTKRVMIGKELFVGVGGGKDAQGNETPPKSILIMKDDGTILLKGVKIYIEAEDHVQITSAMIDNN